MDVLNCTTEDLVKEMENLRAQLTAAQQELALYHKHGIKISEDNVNIQSELDKSELLRRFATEMSKYSTSIKALSDEIMTITKLRNLRAEESMAAPSREHAIRIIMIIRGENVPIMVDVRHQLSAARAAALILSHNVGAYPSSTTVVDWKITDEIGRSLDPNEVISKFNFPNNIRLFLSL